MESWSFRAMTSCGREAAFVFEMDAADFPSSGFAEQVENLRRSFGRWQAIRADVGNTVALRVGVTRFGIVHEIGAQAVGRDQAGPLADKGQREGRANDAADLVLQRHACV